MFVNDNDSEIDVDIETIVTPNRNKDKETALKEVVKKTFGKRLLEIGEKNAIVISINKIFA